MMGAILGLLPGASAILRWAPWAAAGLLLIGLLWYRGSAIDAAAERDAVALRLETQRAMNQRQSAIIADITARREADDALLRAWTARLGELTAEASATRSTLRDLERSNAAIRDFLAARLPDDLGRLLNRPATSGTTRGHP